MNCGQAVEGILATLIIFHPINKQYAFKPRFLSIKPSLSPLSSASKLHSLAGNLSKRGQRLVLTNVKDSVVERIKATPGPKLEIFTSTTQADNTVSEVV